MRGRGKPVTRPSQRTPRPLSLSLARPQSRPHTPKKRHLPALSVPDPPTRTPCARLVPYPHLRYFSPRCRPEPRSFANPLSKYAQPCYTRAREGPTHGPGSLPKGGVGGPGIRSGVPSGRRVAAKTPPVDPSVPCPLLPCGATLLRQHAHSGTTELRRTAGAHSYGSRRIVQKLTDFTGPHPRGNEGSLDAPGKPAHFPPRFGALRAVCRRLKMPSKKSICQRSEGDSK